MTKERKKRGPNKGSRPAMLLSLKPGQRVIVEAPIGKTSAVMQQMGADISRNGLSGKIKLSQVLGVEVSTREVVEMILITRLEDEEIAA